MHIDAICGFECMSINVSKNVSKSWKWITALPQQTTLAVKKKGGYEWTEDDTWPENSWITWCKSL